MWFNFKSSIYISLPVKYKKQNPIEITDYLIFMTAVNGCMKKCMYEQENAHSQIRKTSICVLSEK
jgi:hypothetical protein